MEASRSEILVRKLISNSLTAEELDELLAAIQEEEANQDMGQLLEKYFDELVEYFSKRPSE